MKQFRLEHGFFYRKRYIPALDYTIEDFGNGERYITGMNGNVPVSIKLTKGLVKKLRELVGFTG